MNKESIAFVISFDAFLHESMKARAGRGNGYVALPKGHPLYGQDSYDVMQVLSVHGGITYMRASNEMSLFKIIGDFRIVGFDTLHAGDDKQRRPEEKVIEETKRLKQQLDAMR